MSKDIAYTPEQLKAIEAGLFEWGPDHRCRETRTCCCYGLADEPSPDCPIHAMGSWPPRCEVCGRFIGWREEK